MKIISVPIIVTIIYVLYTLIKKPLSNNKKLMEFLPFIVAIFGGVLGIIIYFSIPSIISAKNFLDAFLMGIISGLTSIGSEDIVENFKKNISERKETKNKEDIKEDTDKS